MESVLAQQLGLWVVVDLVEQFIFAKWIASWQREHRPGHRRRLGGSGGLVGSEFVVLLTPRQLFLDASFRTR